MVVAGLLPPVGQPVLVEHVDLDDMAQRVRVAQGGGVDLGFEAFVVAAQRVHDLPDDLVFRTVGQRDVRVHVLGHEDRDDDVPVPLAVRLAHDAADALHDVRAALARAQVDDRVQRGHVHALGQAARVRQDMAFAVVLREIGELVGARDRVHAAVHVIDLERDVPRLVHQRAAFLGERLVIGQGGGVRVDHVLELAAELLGRLDAGRERDRMMQHAARVVARHVRVIGHTVRAAGVATVEQGLPDADELGLVVDLDLDRVAQVVLHGRRQHPFADVHDHDLVVGQDPLLDRLAEPQVVAHPPVGLLVVHARDHHRALGGLPLRAGVVDARGRGHVHALRRMQEPVVVHLLERALAVHHARGAVRLVADDQIEVRQAQLLRLGDHADRLVGGEHHVQRVRALHEPAGDRVRVRGRRERDVRQLAVVFVVLQLGSLAVRTHHVQVDSAAYLVHPAAHRLRHQTDRRGQEQHRAARTHLLRQTQRGQRLARAARHHRQRAVMIHQLGLDRVDRLALVVARLEHRARIVRVPCERAPIDVRLADPLQIHADDVPVRMQLDVLLEVVAHGRRGIRDHEMLVPVIRQRGHEERAHVLVRQLLRIALRLERPILPVQITRHQIDACIRLALGQLLRRVIPHPYMLEPVRPRRIMTEEMPNYTLPTRALLLDIDRIPDDTIQHRINTNTHDNTPDDHPK